MEEYKAVTPSSYKVPTSIRVTTTDRSGRADTIAIELGTLRQTTFDDEQRLAFARNPREADKFGHVYRLVNGYWVPQTP